MFRANVLTLRWLGSDAPHLDQPFVARCGDVVIGCYGGNTSAGAHKNEDAALVWCATDGSWKFAVLLDAHLTTQSAQLVLELIEVEQETILAILSRPPGEAFSALHQLLADHFRSKAFKVRCRTIQGETACLICAQKEQFLWWWSVGDCLVYLLHPELAQRGQYALNQRGFYEWIGRANTFELPVPCYASGVRELRRGCNHILMTTDGLLECGSRPFENARYLYEVLAGNPGPASSVRTALQKVHQERGRDSATVIYWRYDNKDRACTFPSGEDARAPISTEKCY